MTGDVTALTDEADILPYATADPVWCVYALGDLEPPFFADSQWFACGDTLALVYHGLQPPVLFAAGSVAGFAQTLRHAPLPTSLFFHLRDWHVAELERLYQVRERRRMVRMTLKTFRPPAAGPASVRLGPADLERLARFYASSGMPVYGPDQVRAGVFYGVFTGNVLASVAGTHVLSDRHGVAALGNVYTMPTHRRRGLASAATSAVAAELRQRGIGTIVLNVEADNAAARRVYARLGFVEALEYLEGVAERSDCQGCARPP